MAAIRVENLAKSYSIGGPVAGYRTLRDSISQMFGRARRNLGRFIDRNDGKAANHTTIWALKDVSFEVQPGEVVGIIGKNGAGKSTLLKVLSRITDPTQGRVEILGRVGSLLEVGTGFHPELTGRENVYLNGAILGMKRSEVDKKFDEIVSFAEVEKFIDTPVKHYSSGMYVRLAFSVAAHLDTDILLVDEVLSVGDVKFQQKCMGRMQDQAFSDKTILFVSHNLAAVGNFCPRTVLLEQGQLVRDGATRWVLPYYLGEGEPAAARELASASRRGGKGEGWRCLRRVSLLDEEMETCTFTTGGGWRLRIECEFPEELAGRGVNLGFVIEDSMQRVLIGSNMQQYGRLHEARMGIQVFEASLKRLALVPGRYQVSLYLGDGQRDYEVIENAIQFDVAWLGDGNATRPPHVGILHETVEWK
jgi:lipopolysaccharide transport system ATP-binding protein